MTTDQLVSNYSPVVDIVSFITSAVILYVIAKALYFSQDRKFVFLKIALYLVGIGALCNIGFYMVIIQYGYVPVAIFALRDVYHICFLLCLYCFTLYVKKMLDVNGPGIKIFSYAFRTLFAICLVLDVLSPFTRFGFYLENGRWYDSMLSPYNLFYAFAALSCFGMLAFESKRLIKSVRICLIVTVLVIAVIMIGQAILNINTLTSYTYVLPILVVLILLHSKPFEDITGALDAGSFDNYIHQLMKKGKSVDYMVLKLDVNTFEKVPDELGKTLNSFWHSTFKNAMLFHMSTDLFVLVIPRESKNGDTESKIDYLMHEIFPKYYTQFQLPYRIIGLYDMSFVEKVSDFIEIVKYLLSIMDENTSFVVDEKKKEELKLYKAITENLADIEKKNNLEDERVLVYCQPIRNMSTGKYDTAESLMRLNLPDIGIVMPGMFVPIAENYNHIHTLTRILLNKLCKKIKELENEGYQFERISVNIAASEIKLEDFCDEIFEIISRNGVNPTKIGIELTETQNERDFIILKNKMKLLKEAGMTLYLDDVGTGYSNLDRIVRYDVDVVKFDRFFLLEAEKNMKIEKMIQHLSQAFRDLDYRLLYEGVETKEHEELCLNCGADYIQGFKYSKPVPIEEVKNFFSRA